MEFVINFLKGLAMGVAAIAPGVSGGAIAVIFGIYEKINNAIANIFKDLKSKIIFFLPIGLGGIVGVLAFSRVIQYLFENYEVEVKYLFIGLMIGTFPSLFKQASKRGFKRTYVFCLIITFAITIALSMLNNQSFHINDEAGAGFIELIIYGAIIGFGTIIPGISASFILMYLGAYEIILDAISSINIMLLAFAGIGFVLSIVLFAKLIDYLFKKVYGYTYFAVLGFVVGSIVPIFPGFQFSFKYFICLIIFIVGFNLSYYLSKFSKE